jgi:hypothetical protein
MYIIKHIQPEPEKLILKITYSDGVVVLADFKSLLQKGGVMSRLADAAVFARARIGPRGRSVAWDDDIDFCADGLRLKWGNPESKF